MSLHSPPPRRAAAIGVSLLALAFIAPTLLMAPTQIALNDDWTQIFAFNAYLGDHLASGSLPHRSHVLGGGFPIVGHPEYPILSPLTLPILAFGPVVGTKFNVVLVYLLGIAGMWLLTTRTLKLSVTSSAWATGLLAVCGWYPSILVSGNYPQIYYYWWPLLLHLVVGDGDVPWFDGKLLLACVLAAVALTDGHLNAVSVILFVGVWAAMSGRRAVVRAGVFAMCTGLLAAFKLLPTLALLQLEDRSIDTYSLATIEVSRFAWDDFMGGRCRPDGFALGWAPWLMAAAGLACWRRAWRPAVVAVVAGLLWMGPTSPVDLFWLLSRLPVLRSIDAPSKYFVVFGGVSVIILSAYGLELLEGRWRLAVAGVAVALSVPLAWQGSQDLRDLFPMPDPPTTRRSYAQLDTDYFVRADWSGPTESRPDLYVFYQRGIPLVRWEDNFQLPAPVVPRWTLHMDGRIVKNREYVGEAWMADGTPAKLEAIAANTLAVEAPTAGMLVVNQVFDPGWTCDVGATADAGGLLSVDVSAAGLVRCTYTSAPLMWGGAVSVLSFLVMIVLWRRRRGA